MGENTKIEWATHTFNPWTGCTKVSPACKNCYAEAWAKRSGLVKWGDTVERRRTSDANWREPVKWNSRAREAGERPRVFCASLADVFENRPELTPWRADLLKLIYDTPHLDWLLLTKRPENWRDAIDEACEYAHGDTWESMWTQGEAPENVWIGATVENQEQADKRIPELLKIPARVRFLSCEPLLGPIQLGVSFVGGSFALYDYGEPGSKFHWVIAGGESGPRARPLHPDWARSLRDQCKAAGVPFFMKQMTKKTPIPEDLFVREFPNAQY
jgi:protein gp37